MAVAKGAKLKGTERRAASPDWVSAYQHWRCETIANTVDPTLIDDRLANLLDRAIVLANEMLDPDLEAEPDDENGGDDPQTGGTSSDWRSLKIIGGHSDVRERT